MDYYYLDHMATTFKRQARFEENNIDFYVLSLHCLFAVLKSTT